MDELNEVYKKIQMHLMKKSQEYGELKLLTSCITLENNNHITDICNSITNIFETYNIPTKEKTLIDNEKCVQSYKYLLLNTDFKNQERLAEDIINGYLVDMCPSLSPYLFIQILWNLEYEKILIESILHIPFDLCAELLYAIMKCIDKLPFQRSVESIYQLIHVVYTRFLRLREVGIQSINIAESIERLSLCFEEFLLMLTNAKLSYLRIETPRLRKSEQHGIILKKLICAIRKCFVDKNREIAISPNLEKLYNITFGREAFIKCESANAENVIKSLNQLLTQLLLDKIKEIDCSTYLDWAELDDEENRMLSLQQSVGIECYYFIQFAMNDEELLENTQLIECLKQMMSKPDLEQPNSVLELQILCCAISNGKKDLMKELLCRYKEWDDFIIDFVYNHKSLLEKKDCLTLLEYLTFVLTRPIEEDTKEFNYTLVTKILLFQSIPDMYEIVIMYLTKHDGKNCLESPHTEEAFHEFITKNKNLELSRNLKNILLFLLKNPRMILSTLLKIAIGYSQYRNIMVSPNDLLLLSSFLQIREDDNRVLVTSILKDICMENVEWNYRKFMNFVQIMLDGGVIKVHALINNVFIPYLREDIFKESNIKSVLTNIDKLQVKCNKNTNIKDLIVALAKNMSYLRKNTSISKYIISEILLKIKRILHYFLEVKGLPFSIKRKMIGDVESIIEPIDKLYFAPLWYLMQKGVSVIDVIEVYERRCFLVLNRLKEDPKTSEKLRQYVSDLSLLREDFLRHLIIRSTEEEYQKLGFELTIVYWFAFGWNDEIDAFDHFLRLTIEACCLCLEYPCIGAHDLFEFLLDSLGHFCRRYMLSERLENFEGVYHSLIKIMNQLNGSIQHGCKHNADLFTTFLTNLNNSTENDTYQLIYDIVNCFNTIGNCCFECSNEYRNESRKIPHSLKISNFYATHEVISACMKVPASEAFECIRRMNELFVSD